MVSTRLGPGMEFGAAGGGFAVAAPAFWLGISAGGRASCASAGTSKKTVQAAIVARATAKSQASICPERQVRSKRVANYRIQDDHKSSNHTGNQSQPPLNEMTDGFTEPLEGPSQNEEPSAARNQT